MYIMLPHLYSNAKLIKKNIQKIIVHKENIKDLIHYVGGRKGENGSRELKVNRWNNIVLTSNCQ